MNRRIRLRSSAARLPASSGILPMPAAPSAFPGAHAPGSCCRRHADAMPIDRKGPSQLTGARWRPQLAEAGDPGEANGDRAPVWQRHRPQGGEPLGLRHGAGAARHPCRCSRRGDVIDRHDRLGHSFGAGTGREIGEFIAAPPPAALSAYPPQHVSRLSPPLDGRQQRAQRRPRRLRGGRHARVKTGVAARATIPNPVANWAAGRIAYATLRAGSGRGSGEFGA